MPLRLIALLLAGLLGAAGAAAAGRLHVPSPDWRDQIVYFVLTDRFDDGDPSNNDQGAGEFDPTRGSHYSGGDLRGLKRRLDYIQGLGATALWITPPVANRWVDPTSGHTGYHGYWAEHFGRVDRHLGTLADLRALARALHGRGMFLVQDIVVNHTGNFFDYGPAWDAADPARDWRPNLGSRPVSAHGRSKALTPERDQRGGFLRTAPSQHPFELNDPRRARDRRAGIYHWTPAVRDYADPQQEANFQMSGLDDLNTENPLVRRALRASYGAWIHDAGVDAFRVDTAFYVPPEFFADFLRMKNLGAPGVLEAARRSGRRDFLVFGEGFGIDRPFDDSQARKIERWMTDARGRPLMPGMLNFPLYGALGDVFARGRPTAELAHRIERMMSLHARPHWMPTFVDNHDVDRFLAGASPAALSQALLAMFTLPGIPVVYYGTEQGFTEPRAAMFAAGWGAGGRDHFDTGAPLYRTIAALSALRRGDKVFTRGRPALLAREAAGAGAIAWAMQAPGRRPALVVLNSADHEVLLEQLPTGLPAGTVLRGRFGLDGAPQDLRVGADGRVTVVLPPRAGWVWQAAGAAAGRARDAAAPSGTAGPAPTLDAVPAVATGDFAAGGLAPGVAELKLVVDGDLARARTVRPEADGRWRANVDTSAMVDAGVEHRLVAWDPARGLASAAVRFRVERAWRLLAEVDDPADDDRGPQGRYRYPADASYAASRTLDLRRLRVLGAGGALRLELSLAGLAASWNPANGFDHLALTVFLELPGQPGGASVMPQQNATLPEGMRWHRRLRVHGWSNALFTADGASATSEGTPAGAAAAIAVDRERRTVTLTLPAAALGHPATLSGARVYVNTWDYDGGYRALTPEGGGHVFGGGDGARDPRVMDDSAVVVVP